MMLPKRTELSAQSRHHITAGDGLILIEPYFRESTFELLKQAAAERPNDLMLLVPDHPHLSLNYNPAGYGNSYDLGQRLSLLLSDDRFTTLSPPETAVKNTAIAVDMLKQQGIRPTLPRLIKLMGQKIQLESVWVRMQGKLDAVSHKNLLGLIAQYQDGKPPETTAELIRRMTALSAAYGKQINDKTAFSLYQAIRGQKIIYFAKPTVHGNPLDDAFCRLFYHDLQSSLSHCRRKYPQVCFAIEEDCC